MKYVIFVSFLFSGLVFADSGELDSMIMQKVGTDHQAEVRSGVFAQRKASVANTASTADSGSTGSGSRSIASTGTSSQLTTAEHSVTAPPTLVTTTTKAVSTAKTPAPTTAVAKH